ncbi:uncharacterized protein F5Z01DRAFT_674159 [Emericellopsis atlantica]|uniref:Inclusion body clearance protein IML2 n=1 Tax=Emericellopsis atlantica TaxID=2614577 RepID=A0A9P7ZMX5_9HYPO|nr:uncharacterized protein F5Z01DRAFT_674159 [Emericellopsis atlantica]KAG9254418.1 hypothetical protein F5Z01DRAFT_674159 [Emericellopsis atlantica]
MSKLGGWLRANVKSDHANPEKERRDLVEALDYAQLIMNDDIDAAYEALRKGGSSFHSLGAAVAFFMRSVLGMEKSIMAETTDMLNACENKAFEDAKLAERRGKRAEGNGMYPAGTEYELIRAEVWLMGAVVGVLHESLVEAMKSFYKLRKAFLTLDGIIQIEKGVIGEATPGEAFSDQGTSGENTPRDKDDSGSEVFVDAKETLTPVVEEKKELITAETTPEPSISGEAQTSLPVMKPPAETELLMTDPVDVFIHSGANMCFGILMLMLTLVPPSFSRILSVVGFRGDRSQGVSMLWRSSTHDNINGAVAGMALLGYYQSLLGIVDVLPHERDYDEAAETVGPPREKCARLLATMRERYPDSRLWQIEDSRRLSIERRMCEAMKLLTTGKAPKIRQVAAFIDFELALVGMYVQDWPVMRDAFLKAVDTNDWSPALYWFMAGCACIEMYRDARRNGDENESRRQKAAADKYLKKAPTVVGKKKLMAGKLPFEVFLQKRLQRWEERAAQLGVDVVDAVGISPAMELTYFWNGTKRMNETELANAVDTLSWERCTCGDKGVELMKSELDEMGTWAVCMSSVKRQQGDYVAARGHLNEHVLLHDRAVFKGPTKNDFVLPAAEYEVGAIAWEECGAAQDDTVRKERLEECAAQLEKVKNWEAFTLDMRIGLKVQSGLETLKWFRAKKGWH